MFSSTQLTDDGVQVEVDPVDAGENAPHRVAKPRAGLLKPTAGYGELQ